MATRTKEPDAPDTEQENGNGHEPSREAEFNIDAMLDLTRQQFVTQREALRPQYEAFLKLDSIVENFDRIASGEFAGRRQRGTTATASTGSSERAGRGTRPQEFLTVVREAGEEGIRVSDAADKMGLDTPNYLYRLAPKMVEDGHIRKEGQKYFAV